MTEENVVREALTVQQRIAKGRQMKRLAPKMARARKIKSKKKANPEQLQKRANKMAIGLLRKKLAGKKGANYANLSPSDKMQVDKKVEAKKAIIPSLAKKLIGKVRKKEALRMASRNKSKNESLERKANLSGYDIEILEKVYDRGIADWDVTFDLSEERYAMGRVNSFIHGGTQDNDLVQESLARTIKYAASSIVGAKKWDKMVQAYVNKMESDPNESHGKSRAFDIAREFGIDEPRMFINMINKAVRSGKIDKKFQVEEKEEL
jgi:hypothetical protein